jgi:hypothetical protein
MRGSLNDGAGISRSKDTTMVSAGISWQQDSICNFALLGDSVNACTNTTCRVGKVDASKAQNSPQGPFGQLKLKQRQRSEQAQEQERIEPPDSGRD